MFFCSLLAVTREGVSPTVFSTRHDGFVVNEFHGVSRSGPYYDTLLTAFAEDLPECELQGLRCRARDLAVRRDADGRAIYVVGSGAEYVDVDGVQLEIEPAGTVEWKRGAP